MIDTNIFHNILKLESFRDSRLLVIFLSQFFKFRLEFRMMEIRRERVGNWKASDVRACTIYILTGVVVIGWIPKKQFFRKLQFDSKSKLDKES